MKNVDSRSHVRGESIYLDDIQLVQGTLFACVFDSPIAHGKLVSIDAAEALKPFGPYAYLLFCAGLLNASVFAACILPLSTAYSVCEGLGFESGVNKTFSEAPIFYWLITLLITIGGGIVLLPNFPLVQMILFSQVVNGMLLPLVLIFMTILVNKNYLLKEWTNSRVYNFVSWTAVAVMIGLTVGLVGISLHDLLR